MNALTAVINRHGALVLSAMPYDGGTPLTIQNELTSATTPCRVVWVGDLDPSDAYKIGVEFVGDAPNFWGIVYEERMALSNTTPSLPPMRPR